MRTKTLNRRVNQTLILFLLFPFMLSAGAIKGNIKDKTNKEPLPGATVQVMNTSIGAVAGLDGNFEIHNLESGVYTLEVKYVSYKTTQLANVKVDKRQPAVINIELEPESQALGDVTILARVKKNTENALLTSAKNSLLVQSGVSAQQIARTQDKDASEAIKRVPGVSIIDDKFVMVRGLSQRYNNIWINNSAVPSSEADSRAFSFDIIPSSQLDNMIIVKSPAPEYPADFSGGFIIIETKDMPEENAFHVSLGGNINDRTHFRNFLHGRGSGTDFLGFDKGMRSLRGGVRKGLVNTFGDGSVNLMKNGFNNDWKVRSMHPAGDLKFNLAFNRKWEAESGRSFGMLASVNYSHAYKSFTDMENSMFGSYDITHGRSVYLRKSLDNQYNSDVRIGAMLNLVFQPKSTRNRFEFKNIFNQLGKDRYTERAGVDAQSNNERSMEYYYSSRTTYNGQFAGKHTLHRSKIDWSAGYAYANRNLPDRRRILLNDALEPGKMGWTSANDISREFTRLDEHIFSGNMNYRRDFSFGTFAPVLKAGIYGEYRTRKYNTRQFNYNWANAGANLPEGFRYMDIVGEVLLPQNYGEDKIRMLEEVKKKNDYSGNNIQGAGYAGLGIPLEKLDIYAGLRYEYNKTELIGNTRDHEVSPHSMVYSYKDLFPSVNAAYKFTGKQLLRFAYGKSVNRPEFRELSASVFYDFELASNVEGNPSLKAAYIHNIDLRYEFYPSAGELVSVSLFYKNFSNPIEWTYTVNGGTDLTYSYKNAKAADNYGIELDVRKNLDFMGLRNFSWSFNGALIKSKVKFEKGSKEKDRAMQGQSPYLINTGIFYGNPKTGLSAAVLYNRIGKRIIGVGRTVGTTGGEETNNIPNSYEMPRNAIDLSIGKKFGKWEARASLRDLLAERVYFKQFGTARGNGKETGYEETTKSYRPGRTYGLSLSYTFD